MRVNLGTVQYSLREPFGQAVESVCRSLNNRGLERWREQLDLSRRIERTLGIVLPPCGVVLVLPDPSKLSAASVHPWAATFLPLHIVISAKDATQTEIQVQNRVARRFRGRRASNLWPSHRGTGSDRGGDRGDRDATGYWYEV